MKSAKAPTKGQMVTAIMDRETQWVTDSFTAARLPNPQAIRRAELMALPITDVRDLYLAVLAKSSRARKNVLGRWELAR